MHSDPESSGPNPLATYLSEINRYGLLSGEQERRLARRFERGDLGAGHLLVTSNLRFVVKVSYQYRSYGVRMADLLQEGNIGLMKAVQKFDPDKGIRLISYAVWWIRAYIQNYILKSWSLVKLGTTQAQRKLFFSLSRTRRELEKLSVGDAPSADVDEIARRLRVKPTEVREMEQRMGGRDLSLDAPIGDEGANAHIDIIPSEEPRLDDSFADREEAGIVSSRVRNALDRLDARERFIIQQRVMNERPMTLKELGEYFGFSRERARQLEIRAKDKLRGELEPLLSEVDPGALAAG
jgi:RNA polymerase sigma-32 factor